MGLMLAPGMAEAMHGTKAIAWLLPLYRGYS